MWKYLGPGFLPGVPARDLSDEEAESYGVENSGLYERDPKSKKAKEVVDEQRD